MSDDELEGLTPQQIDGVLFQRRLQREADYEQQREQWRRDQEARREKHDREMESLVRTQRIRAFGIMLIVIGGIVALLAGCETVVEPESQQGTQGSVSTFWATTVDDRRIPCVSWQSMGNHAGGLSCDWSLK